MRLLSLLACILYPAGAFASGNICFHNGRGDDGQGTPQHFTGEYRCKDMDTGKVTSVVQYVDGMKDGKFVEHDETTGALEAEGRYRRDRFDGVVKRYQDGKLTSETTYVEGEVIGVQKEYRDGALARLYLKTGADQMDVEFELNPDGQPMQLTCGRRFIGSQDAEWCGHNGKLSTVSLYTKKGALSKTVQYLWGKQSGVERTFNVKTGKVIREERYENGELVQGGRRRFDKEGALLAKTDCDDARKKCTETVFFEGGKLPRLVTQWSNGRKARETTYFQNGKPASDLIAEKDKYRITEYYDCGKERVRGTYVPARTWYWMPYLPDGVIEYLDRDGALSRRETYKEGKLEGRAEHFLRLEGHAIDIACEYSKDRMLKRRISVDGKAVAEFEYFPDGSIKSKRRLGPSPVKELDT